MSDAAITSSDPAITPEERYDALVEALLGTPDTPDVAIGLSGKKGFGSSALTVNDKIFAMLAQGTLVVKLPKARVDALVSAGTGERFDPRHDGRLMKEWLVVAPTSNEDWLTLAQEAMVFVSSQR